MQLQFRPTDTLSGTVTVRNANWKADYLANHVEISEATLHVDLRRRATAAGTRSSSPTGR